MLVCAVESPSPDWLAAFAPFDCVTGAVSELLPPCEFWTPLWLAFAVESLCWAASSVWPAELEEALEPVCVWVASWEVERMAVAWLPAPAAFDWSSGAAAVPLPLFPAWDWAALACELVV